MRHPLVARGHGGAPWRRQAGDNGVGTKLNHITLSWVKAAEETWTCCWPLDILGLGDG
jgi:hypothetical protein